MQLNPPSRSSKLSRLTLFCLSIISLIGLTGYTLVCLDSESRVTSGQSQDTEAASLDAELRTLIAAHELSGDPSTGRDLPSIHSPIAQLGKKLFFTKALGGDLDVACVSCHHPQLGGGDGLSLSIGIGAHNPDLLGPGRTHPNGAPNVPRNAPTTFNIALWDQVLFWDGRVESLGKTPGAGGDDGIGIRTPDVALGVADPLAGQNLAMAQSRFPVTSIDEMRGHQFAVDRDNHEIRNQLAYRLGGYRLSADRLGNSRHWMAAFEVVFGPVEASERLVTEQRIAAAIAAYERSQIFVNSPWKAYVQGDDAAISETAKEGALLFFNSVADGGANCASCHRGDFFTDEQFHSIALPQVGPGKEEQVEGADFGRFRETGNPRDLFAFRTPSLLNVEATGPYGHSGAYTTLEGIIRHHLNPIEGCKNYDAGQLDPTIPVDTTMANTERVMHTWMEMQNRGIWSLQEVDLDDQQVSDLVAFLHTLTDPCVKDAACLEPWLPYAGEDNFDENRLMAQIPFLNQ